MSSTPEQTQATAASGNIVLVAGAGTGKTHTLVERCLHCLLHESPPASLDQILMVTFTEAAAAEMRQRIRERLEEQLKRAPNEMRWHEQLALFESAHIGTLHSFCFELVRQHFYELELDPNLVVLPEEEARLLAEETLDAVLKKHYAGESPFAPAVQQLIQIQGRGSDDVIRSMVVRLHNYTQTLPEPTTWFSAQRQLFADPQPRVWREWLAEALVNWRSRSIIVLDSIGNELATHCAELLRNASHLPANPGPLLEAISNAVKNLPRGRKTACTQPLKEFLAETSFLVSFYAAVPAPPAPFAGGEGKGDEDAALSEDWSWVRPHMLTLLELAAEFTTAFSEAKRELGSVDFHDLEQHALRLLRDPKTGRPTAIGQEWRRKLRFVFVDEYQDINAAQDKIIEALSREPERGNRFLVGDVKQSIYRFRLANPHIFQQYTRSWTPPVGTCIPLRDNFRSRESILSFINSFFSLVMAAELGGVSYDEQAALRFGAPAERRPLSLAASPERCVELHLRLQGQPMQPEFEEITESARRVADLVDAEKEARLVGIRLAELKAARHPIWDGQKFRPVDWSDMAILLRAPSNKVEGYAKEFARLNIPLLVARGGFYDSLEILDLLSLLQILDNPLQDIPLLAVLHSPLAGLDINELATIRLAARGPFWKALLSWKTSQADLSRPEAAGAHSSTREKVFEFLDRFAAWRRLARRVSLSECLETVLSETHYVAWLLAQPRGQQRQANVQRLLGLARQYDRFQRQGLFRFLKFIESQKLVETQPEVPTACEENAVRLMSVHQSKGLEFPVVVVPDLGKSFNLTDLRADIILDEQYGLSPQVKPPHTGRRYPSLPFWLARRRQLRETLGEEARLLYVAMTRARDLLILTAGIARSAFAKRWTTPTAVNPENLATARRASDWLAQWFAQHSAGIDPAAARGQNPFLRWIVHEDSALIEAPAAIPEIVPPGLDVAEESEAWRQLQERLTWKYPFPSATRQPAKTSVTTLRRTAAELAEAAPLQADDPLVRNSVARRAARLPGSASEIGIVHHAFLQHVSLEALGSAQQIEQAGKLLVQEGILKQEQAALLDFAGLAVFWDSPLGNAIRGQWPKVQRELEFTARFTPAELSQITGEMAAPDFKDEFVIVQGVVDLAMISDEEIWLVDFKTDAVAKTDLALKAKQYAPQLKLYARALERIYGRRVTQAWLHFLHLRTSRRVDV